MLFVDFSLVFGQHDGAAGEAGFEGIAGRLRLTFDRLRTRRELGVSLVSGNLRGRGHRFLLKMWSKMPARDSHDGEARAGFWRRAQRPNANRKSRLFRPACSISKKRI